jgi:hypothetical protein
MGIRDKPTAPTSPCQNGFAERLIGSIRRECVDHLIVLGEAHLRRILRAYARYCNDIRTHWSLAKDAPVSRPIQRTGSIQSYPYPWWASSLLRPGLDFRYRRPFSSWQVCTTNTSAYDFQRQAATDPWRAPSPLPSGLRFFGIESIQHLVGAAKNRASLSQNNPTCVKTHIRLRTGMLLLRAHAFVHSTPIGFPWARRPAPLSVTVLSAPGVAKVSLKENQSDAERYNDFAS